MTALTTVLLYNAGGSGTSDVDGGWSLWTTWSACSASCAGGTQWRQRTCSAPVPSGTGHDCPGPGHESRPCSDHPCVGQWSCWSDLGPCSLTCGPGGTRRRRRRCQRLPGVAISCHGNDTEMLPCDGPIVPCPGPGMTNTVKLVDNRSLYRKSWSCRIRVASNSGIRPWTHPLLVTCSTLALAHFCCVICIWMRCVIDLRPQSTRRTSWQTSWQLVASLVVFYIPLVQQVANLHVVIDSGCQLVGNPKSYELVANYLVSAIIV